MHEERSIQGSCVSLEHITSEVALCVTQYSRSLYRHSATWKERIVFNEQLSDSGWHYHPT